MLFLREPRDLDVALIPSVYRFIGVEVKRVHTFAAPVGAIPPSGAPFARSVDAFFSPGVWVASLVGSGSGRYLAFDCGRLIQEKKKVAVQEEIEEERGARSRSAATGAVYYVIFSFSPSWALVYLLSYFLTFSFSHFLSLALVYFNYQDRPLLYAQATSPFTHEGQQASPSMEAETSIAFEERSRGLASVTTSWGVRKGYNVQYTSIRKD